MFVMYVGPFAAVDVRDAPQLGSVEHGAVVEVSDELGAALCEQPSNWVAAEPDGETWKIIEHVASETQVESTDEEEPPVETADVPSETDAQADGESGDEAPRQTRKRG